MGRQCSSIGLRTIGSHAPTDVTREDDVSISVLCLESWTKYIVKVAENILGV